MSAEVWIEQQPCKSCGRKEGYGAELQITYNLTPMGRPMTPFSHLPEFRYCPTCDLIRIELTTPEGAN